MLNQVLIIDPSPADSATLKGLLERTFKARVILAGRTSIGEEEIKTNHPSPFDLIILDIDQPDTEDIHAVLRMRKMAPKIPILVIANEIDPLIFFRAFVAGATEVVPKNLLNSAVSLENIVRLTLDRWNN